MHVDEHDELDDDIDEIGLHILLSIVFMQLDVDDDEVDEAHEQHVVDEIEHVELL